MRNMSLLPILRKVTPFPLSTRMRRVSPGTGILLHDLTHTDTLLEVQGGVVNTKFELVPRVPMYFVHDCLGKFLNRNYELVKKKRA